MGKVHVRTAAEVADSTLADRKEEKRQGIRNAFVAETVEPLTALGMKWHGGYESAIRLEGACRLAERSGDSVVTLYDTCNVGHTLSREDANEVVNCVAARFQADFAKKQSKMGEIEHASTLADVERIAWQPS